MGLKLFVALGMSMIDIMGLVMKKIEFEGKLVEAGDLTDYRRGLAIDVRPEMAIHVTGFTVSDMMSMEIPLYKKVRLTIEVIE